ncbi:MULTISPECIES: hypothetical protein [unclassified Streptomyces]|uniref:hypothetical protein n=1 Tax=unclassified Streptomyces TaxID=2593676 RepID=UPI00332122CA
MTVRARLLDREVGRAPSSVGAAAHFDGRRLARLIGLITAGTGRNRVMVGRRVEPGGYQP